MLRRSLLLGAGALAACGAGASKPSPQTLAPLKDAASFPLGLAAMTGQFDDGGWTQVARTHFDRITPEWEMKMEAILLEDGGLDFSRSDQLVARARQMGLGVFGHALIWYAQGGPSFEALADRPAEFRRAYRGYIARVMGRYRGQVTGWDVVNEPIRDDGSGLRDCLWSRALGQDGYIIEAFEAAREADPDVPLFLNDYNLESNPAKRRSFLTLAERLLRAGAPLSGLGTQTHIDCDLPDGAIRQTVRELAALGLPVHVSEIDVSTDAGDPARQPRLFAEAVEAMGDLPPAQRFGVTVWGARDRDSWLRRGGEHNPLSPDRPLLFDDDGRPKPAAQAFAAALRA
ncbi:endo-1,4-beta-xylanase [Brevundimonas sp. 2R-24]|uniref:Beta-xylanase n=1 Tax=Peiella sedimenti TaxID=3061083 RepID=A0ABT8SHM9_9CAUL|nr:endo-1,4-beta-xylanase [Caulobacteraceae bacterium XZ-24]